MNQPEADENRTVADPVCGMKLRVKDVRHTLEYHNDIYYFCSEICRNNFERDPEKYLAL